MTKRLTGRETMKVEAYLSCLDSETLAEFSSLMDYLGTGRDDPLIQDIRQLIGREQSGRDYSRRKFS